MTVASGRSWMRIATRLFLAAMAVALLKPVVAEETPLPASVQLLGTVHDTRGRWNPFLSDNDMAPQGENGVYLWQGWLAADGGRNGDGIYAVRFATDHRLDGTCKADPMAPASRAVCGPVAQADNILFRVPADGQYSVRFSASRHTFTIDPPVTAQTRIESMQINGFVFDTEGSVESVTNGRTRPAEKWDESRASHRMYPLANGGFTKRLALSANGGHEHNGVYQFLFSANGNGDWGYCAINGQPGRLAGGCGYSSRVGRIDESAVVIRVPHDDEYTITVFPDEYRYTVAPVVEILNALPSFQLNGTVFAEPWKPTAADHQMTRHADGRWEKVVRLVPDGGPDRNGIYAISFSIGQEFALDSIAFGGRWGETWHALPQESNILFRVRQAGDYTISLDPAADRFVVSPAVDPIETIQSMKIAGNFDAFADDGSGGWTLSDSRHRMEDAGHGLFTRVLRLHAGGIYNYKYAANDAGWAWSFADYPYDGELRLALHGDPPPLRFVPERSGLYRFEADVVTGRYSILFLQE